MVLLLLFRYSSHLEWLWTKGAHITLHVVDESRINGTLMTTTLIFFVDNISSTLHTYTHSSLITLFLAFPTIHVWHTLLPAILQKLMQNSRRKEAWPQTYPAVFIEACLVVEEQSWSRDPFSNNLNGNSSCLHHLYSPVNVSPHSHHHGDP